MTGRRALVIPVGAVVVLLTAAGLVLWSARVPAVGAAAPVGRAARLSPDYSGVVIPPNVAPMNFRVQERGKQFRVRLQSTRGEAIELVSRTGSVRIPLKPWRRLLQANAGEELRIEIYAHLEDGSWQRYETVSNYIARDPIDRYVVYRQFGVLFVPYVHMRLIQRSLEDFAEEVVLDNRSFGKGCVGCHTAWKNETDRMLIQMRSGREDYGHGMLLIMDGQVRKVNTLTERTPRLAAFSSWHPNGELVAFSINKVRQLFHGARAEIRDGLDLDSDLAIYVLASGAVTSTPSIADEERLETWPAWSADGRYLYFCSSPVPWEDREKLPFEDYRKAMYDLMRIGYDAENRAWGELETVLSAAEAGQSITLPRPSPDGRFLVCCMSEYSTFPAFQRSSDLHLLDLASGEWRRLECNSELSESWHSWSGNSRWLAFGSKRDDGLFEKVYIAHVDESGRASKPFVLPQKDPAFYDSFLQVCHLPELIDQPVPITGERLARPIRSAPWEKGHLPVTGATP